jgi:hypothetical protein
MRGRSRTGAEAPWGFRRRRRRLLAVALAAAGAGCFDFTAEPFVAGLEILAPDTALPQGHELRLSVRAWDIERRPMVPLRLTWGSGDPGVLTVDSAGTARAILGGGGGDVAVWASAGPRQASDTIMIHVAVHGEVKWRLPLGPMPLHGGPAEGPDGMVYVLGQTSLSLPEATLFAATPLGTVSWQRRLTQVDCCNYPFVGRDGAVYVVGQYVWAFSPDGNLRWAIAQRPVEVFPNVPTSHAGAIGDDGTLYAAMAYDLFALRATDGDTLRAGPPCGRRGMAAPPHGQRGRAHRLHQQHWGLALRLRRRNGHGPLGPEERGPGHGRLWGRSCRGRRPGVDPQRDRASGG